MADKIKIRTEHISSDLINISKVIMPVAKQLLGVHGFFMVELLRNWRTVVGVKIAKYALPVKLTFPKDSRRHGCLTIATSNGAFAMEIKQKQCVILNEINSFFGYEAVDTLKIIQTSDAAISFTFKKPTENVQKSVVSADKENYITELTKDIHSPELRETLQKLGKLVTAKTED